mmetsp:Transcript_7785/g.11858  ORF Transcript_7785/g.11858 Transcript_7785/m.11858 type:complete len:214 (-) Transcript_7785:365-1006(-)
MDYYVLLILEFVPGRNDRLGHSPVQPQNGMTLKSSPPRRLQKLMAARAIWMHRCRRPSSIHTRYHRTRSRRLPHSTFPNTTVNPVPRSSTANFKNLVSRSSMAIPEGLSCLSWINSMSITLVMPNRERHPLPGLPIPMKVPRATLPKDTPSHSPKTSPTCPSVSLLPHLDQVSPTLSHLFKMPFAMVYPLSFFVDKLPLWLPRMPSNPPLPSL